MLTLHQAKILAASRSRERNRAQFVNRYYYHNPQTKEKELRYVVEESTSSTRTVFTYMGGEQVL